MKKFIILLVATVVSFSTFGTDNQKVESSDLVVIDVRSSDEYKENHVDGARNIDVNSEMFKVEIKKLDKTKKYKLYCRSGKRAEKALEIMKSEGFMQVENLKTAADTAKTLKLNLIHQ